MVYLQKEQSATERLVCTHLSSEPAGHKKQDQTRLREFGASHFYWYQFLRDRYHGTTSSAPEALEESPVQVVAPVDEGGWDRAKRDSGQA